LAHGGGSVERPPPVLAEAGYDEAEIVTLRREGVI
jgi:hypothetical protein